MSKEEKLKELLVDEDEMFNELIDEIKHLIGINKNDGSILLKFDQEILTDHQKILLYLIGAKFSHDLGLRDSPEVTNQELAEFTNRTTNAISSRVSELKKDKKMTSVNKGRHIVKPLSIKKDIEEIMKQVNEN